MKSSLLQILNYEITWFYFGTRINNFNPAVHQGVSYISGYQFLTLEFRGAIKQRVPTENFGCQRLRGLEK